MISECVINNRDRSKGVHAIYIRKDAQQNLMCGINNIQYWSYWLTMQESWDYFITKSSGNIYGIFPSSSFKLQSESIFSYVTIFFTGTDFRVVQDSILLGYNVMSSQTSRPLNIKALHSFKTSGTNYPVTQHHIPEQHISTQNPKHITLMICNSFLSNRNLNTDSRQSHVILCCTKN